MRVRHVDYSISVSFVPCCILIPMYLYISTHACIYLLMCTYIYLLMFSCIHLLMCTCIYLLMLYIFVLHDWLLHDWLLHDYSSSAWYMFVCLCGTHIYSPISNFLVLVDLFSFILIFDMRWYFAYFFRSSLWLRVGSWLYLCLGSIWSIVLTSSTPWDCRGVVYHIVTFSLVFLTLPLSLVTTSSLSPPYFHPIIILSCHLILAFILRCYIILSCQILPYYINMMP